ncbi:MAG: MCE family protein, partial [Nitrospirae bacterium]
MRESDPRFLHLQWKVGLFIALAALAAGAAILYRLAADTLLVPKAELHFVAPSATGLRPGMAVVLKGFPVGRLTRIALTRERGVVATLALDRRYLSWLGCGSEAVWTPAGPLGNGTIELRPPATPAPPLAPGASLPFRRQTGVTDLLGELGEVRALIGELRTARLGETLASGRRLAAGLEGSHAHLEHLLD